MASRGRPPYPDILTPREWEVLLLLREGLSNARIAERLDITERTAKFHVSEILGKLGVASRDEAATWSPSEPKLRRISVLHWALKWGLLAKVVGATAAAAALGGIAVLAWGVLATGPPTSDGESASSDDLALAAMAGLTLPTCAPVDTGAVVAQPDCIPGYAVAQNLRTEETYYLPGRLLSCGSDPPRDIPLWECHKLFPLSTGGPSPPPRAVWPNPPAGVEGKPCREPDAGVPGADSQAGDTCYDWSFKYDSKIWHCWAAYLPEQGPYQSRPADAGCVGVVAFADNWPSGLPTPPAGANRINWWCDNRAVSPDFVKATCSIRDSRASGSSSPGQ